MSHKYLGANYGYICNITLLSYIQFVFEWEANVVPAGRGLCGRTYVVHIASVLHDSALFAVSQLDSQGDREG